MKLDSAARSSLLARYKSRLQTGQATANERYLATSDTNGLLSERSALIDEVLRDLWRELQFRTLWR